ncbi:hypothetical protein ACVIQT_004028 [Bradyrhizobium diazoefficiens]
MSTSSSRMRDSAIRVGIASRNVTRKNRAARQQIAGRAHHGGGNAIAEGGKPRVAAEPLADRERTDEAEADRGDRRAQHAARRRMQRRGGHDHGEDRHGGIGERAAADGRDGKGGDQPLGFCRVDDRPARHLPDQGDDAANRQHEADLALRPFLRRQIDRDEGAEAGLHVGEEEDEPVEAAQAPARRCRKTCGRRRCNVVLFNAASAILGCLVRLSRQQHRRPSLPAPH